MKYLIILTLLIPTSRLQAQTKQVSAQTPLLSSKILEHGFKSASNFHGSMGEVGTASVIGDLTEFTYCDNSRDERAVKQGNKKDTTTYKISIKKKDNVKTIALSDGTQVTVTDEMDLFIVNVAGKSTLFHKLSAVNRVDPSSNGGQYLISYNKTLAEVKTIYGAGFKFECKGKIAVLINWDGGYQIMIPSGKASFTVNSDGSGSIAVSDGNSSSVWTSDGKQYFIDNDGATSRVNWSNGESQTINNYGALSLLTANDGKLTAMFNYASINPNAGADSGEVTKLTVDKSTIPAGAKR